jgi:exonuclease SbcD
MPVKLLIFSDLHLDLSFAWLGSHQATARRLRQGIRDTLVRILRLTEEEHVDAVLCGGDLYEQERVAPDTAAFLRTSFEAIQPIRVFLAPGNHDWYGPRSLYWRADWPSNVRIFCEPRLTPVQLDQGLTLWGAAHTGPVQKDGFLGDFKVDREGFHLGLFHGSDTTWLLQQGEAKVGHAPFTTEEIRKSGLNHAFLGHYHTPKDDPLYTYPGNPQPLTFGEQGVRGAVLATISDDGRLERQHIGVAQIAFSDLCIDITGIQSTPQIRDRIADQIKGLGGIARITLYGEVPAEIDLQLSDLKQDANSLDACVIRIGDLRPAYNLPAIAMETTVRGQFVRNVQNSDLSAENKRRILIAGLRALDGRSDLEVL